MEISVDRRPVPGQGLQGVGVELRLRAGAARVDQRRLARHRNRFFERADRQLGVDRRGEFRAQFDAGAPEGVEAGQREGDGIRTWPQIDDPIRTLTVGHDDAHFFNQRGTGGLDRHARQHSPGGITRHSGKARLRPGGGRPQRERARNNQKRSPQSSHRPVSLRHQGAIRHRYSGGGRPHSQPPPCQLSR